jgi:uncharacterized pyridoxal phosphate-dependent enzyme
MSPSTSTRSILPPPTYASLGVRTLINCRGTYTVLTGSRALNTVADAMVAASDGYVVMDELMEAVGRRLAELTGAEWGYVSAGCAAALAELTAACIAGADPEKMARLPDAEGMPDEVIIQAAHRNAYDRAMRLAGARMVEVVTRAQLQAALSERTAMIAVIGDQAHLGEIPTPAMIEAGRARGIPVLVDAAAERPDVPNVYLGMGASAVTYSGGKCLRGPQASGLVLGRKDLLWAAWLHGAPHHGVARPMKAGKEEIMGLLAAVEAWVAGRDHQAEWRAWEAALACIAEALAGLASLTTAVEQPGVANVTPTLRITWNPATLGITPAEAHRRIESGDPPIALHLEPGGLLVNPYMMEAGEEGIVAARIREVLAAGAGLAAAEPPAVDVAGEWQVEVSFVLGGARHGLTLSQDGARLTGTYRTRYEEAPVTGEVAGRRVTLRTALGYQSNRTPYRFSGEVGPGGALAGDLDCGEFGAARWRATPIGSARPFGVR